MAYCHLYTYFYFIQAKVNPNLNPLIPQGQGAANLGGNEQPVDVVAQLLAAVQNQRFLMGQALMRLRLLNEDGLDRLIKQIHRDNQGAGLFIPFFSQESVHAIHFWVNRMYILGLPYKLDQVTEEYATLWNQARKSEKEATRTTSALDLVKQPDPFKKETKWRQWKESMTTYLHSKIGHAGLPLAYIIREQDVPNYNKVFSMVHDQLVECAILTGPEYNINNGLVYDLLQSLTLNGPA
jgi:hypothetical protein